MSTYNFTTFYLIFTSIQTVHVGSVIPKDFCNLKQIIHAAIVKDLTKRRREEKEKRIERVKRLERVGSLGRMKTTRTRTHFI